MAPVVASEMPDSEIAGPWIELIADKDRCDASAQR
jgi:hypothetical protein